jgi:hypothetical protein
MVFLAGGGLAERALNRAFALDREHKRLVSMSSLSASARIVCNEEGDWWHVHEDFASPPGVHDWHWKEGQTPPLESSTRLCKLPNLP